MDQETYIQKRQTYKDFTLKVFQYGNDKNTDSNILAAKAMGIYENGVIVFEDEDEFFSQMDFMLYEKNVQSTRLVDQFKNEVQELTEKETEILTGMLNNVSSLFKVKSTNSANSTIQLIDVISKKEFQCMDIGLSNTSLAGIFIYTRLIPLEDVYISSGNSFFFSADLEIPLLSVFRKRLRRDRSASKRKSKRPSLFSIMFHCNRIYGNASLAMKPSEIRDSL